MDDNEHQLRRGGPNRLGIGRFITHNPSFLIPATPPAPIPHVPSHGLSSTGVAQGQPAECINVEPTVPINETPPISNDANERPVHGPAPLHGRIAEAEPLAKNPVRGLNFGASPKIIFLLSGFCVAAAIIAKGRGAVSSSFLPNPLSEVAEGLLVKFLALLDTVTLISGWMAFASAVDCAVPQEGGRVIPELTSPGLGDSRPWLYRRVLGFTAVPVDALLDPHLPHWSFLGDSGHVTLQLHTNATISTVIIESDFAESIPRDIRVWAFAPKVEHGRGGEHLPLLPPLFHRFRHRGLSPTLLKTISAAKGSVPGRRTYHVDRWAQARASTMMVMLEVLSNGGSDITRINLIRVLGIPS